MSSGDDHRNPLYRNWVRAGQCLKYLQQGLSPFVGKLSKRRHQDHLYSYLKVKGSPANCCTECTAENLLPEHPRRNCIHKYRSKCFCNSPNGRRTCPNDFCSRLYDLIILDHDDRNPTWANTDPTKWYSEHWSYAKCYIGTAGHTDKQSSAETDAAGLLSITLNNVEFRSYIDNTRLFEAARDLRNEVLHSATFEIEDSRLTVIINTFQDVLRDKKALVYEADANNVIDILEKIRNNQIYISSQDIEELRKTAVEAIHEKAETALKDIDNRKAEIENTTTTKLQHIEERGTEIESRLEQHFDRKLNAQVQDRSMQTNGSDRKLSDLEKRELQKYLIDKYRSDYLTTDLSPLNPEEDIDVEKLFVPLNLRKRVVDRVETEDVNSLESIFFCGNELARNIYVSGDPGMGKTTLCKKLIADWCKAHTLPEVSPIISVESIPDDSGNNSHEEIVSGSYMVKSEILNVLPSKHDQREDYLAFSTDEDYDYLFDISDASDCSSEGCHSLLSENESSLKCDETASDNLADTCMLNVLTKFEFLFFVSLRDTYQEKFIEDMVINQLLGKMCFEEQLRLLVDTEPEKCLFVLDGLDEWVPPDRLPTHPTITRGLPLSYRGENVTKLFTSRPWKIEMLRPKLKRRDIEIIMFGIKTTSTERLVKLIFDQLTADKDQVNINTVIFLQQVKEKHLESLISVPLMLKLLVCHWNRNNEMEETQTEIFSSFLNNLCSVGYRKNEFDDRFRKLLNKMKIIRLPKCLEMYSDCRRLSALLYSVGRVAFETLFSSTPSLSFSKEELYCHGMSETEYELSLKIGLLSRKRVTAKLKLIPSGSITFIHKTFHEYFASLFIIMKFEFNERIKDKIYKSCISTQNLVQLSKVFYFVKEMNQTLMYEVTKQVKIAQPDFSISLENDELKVNCKKINDSNKNVVNFFMTNCLRGINISSSDLGKHVLRLPIEMNKLVVVVLDSVGMTALALKEMIESIPDTQDGVSVKLRNIALNSVNEKHPITISCKNLQTFEVCFMNVSALRFDLSSQTKCLKSVVLHMVTTTEELLDDFLNNLNQASRKIHVMLDNISFGKSVTYSLNTSMTLMNHCTQLSEFDFEGKDIQVSAIRLILVNQSFCLNKILISTTTRGIIDMLKLLRLGKETAFLRSIYYKLLLDTSDIEISNIDSTDRIVRTGNTCSTLQIGDVHMSDEELCSFLDCPVNGQKSEINIYITVDSDVQDRLNLTLSSETKHFEYLSITFSSDSERIIKLEMASLGYLKINLTHTLITLQLAYKNLYCLSLVNVSMTEKELCSTFRSLGMPEAVRFIRIDNIILTDTSNSASNLWCFPPFVQISRTNLNKLQVLLAYRFGYVHGRHRLSFSHVEMTENAFCRLVTRKANLFEQLETDLKFNKIDLADSSRSERNVQVSRHLYKVHIAQTNLKHISLNFSSASRLHSASFVNVTMTFRAFSEIKKTLGKELTIVSDKSTYGEGTDVYINEMKILRQSAM